MIFRGFKAPTKKVKKGAIDHFRGSKTVSNVKPMYLEIKLKRAMSLEIKKQKTKNGWLFLRINCRR